MATIQKRLTGRNKSKQKYTHQIDNQMLEKFTKAFETPVKLKGVELKITNPQTRLYG